MQEYMFSAPAVFIDQIGLWLLAWEERKGNFLQMFLSPVLLNSNTTDLECKKEIKKEREKGKLLLQQ